MKNRTVIIIKWGCGISYCVPLTLKSGARAHFYGARASPAPVLAAHVSSLTSYPSECF